MKSSEPIKWREGGYLLFKRDSVSWKSSFLSTSGFMWYLKWFNGKKFDLHRPQILNKMKYACVWRKQKAHFFHFDAIVFMHFLANSCSLKIIISLDVLAFTILKWVWWSCVPHCNWCEKCSALTGHVKHHTEKV